MSDSFKKVNPSINRSSADKKRESADRKKEKDNFENLTMLEKIQAKEQAIKERKKKSMDAWGDTGETESFGIWGAVKFSVPRLWRGGCKNKCLLITNLFMVFVVKIAQVINPLILMRVIDSILCEEDESGLSTKTCPTEEETYMLILFYAGVKLAYDMINTFRDIPYAMMAAAAETAIADEVYFHVQSLSLAYHLSRETGKVIRIVSRGSQSFVAVLRQIFYNMLGIFIEIGMTLAVSATVFNWQFTVVQFLSIFVYFSVTYVLTERRAKGFKAKQKADNEYNQKASDGLLNFETVKYFNAEKHEEDRFEKALDVFKKESIKVTHSLVGLNISQTTVIAFGLAATMSLANYWVGLGKVNPKDGISVGAFVLFIQYNQQIYTPLSFLGTLWRFIREAMVNVEQIINLLNVNEKIPEVDSPIEPHITKGKIEFKNVSFTYDIKLPLEEQTTVIENLSFTVEPGTSVGIVGQTGSGKSTIMRLLYRFYDVVEGQILIDGQDISQMKLYDLRNHIGIVPQDCVLFNDSILYNIAYGALNDPMISKIIDDPTKVDELIELIVPAAKRASIHPLVMKTNLGYFAKVGERGLKLSGGEKQRVAIARALLKRTPIMLFDEATSALDTETEKQVQEAINQVSKGATSLIIAHRLSTVKECDKIIVLKHGVIVEEGKHDDLVKIPGGYYAKLWNKQSEQSERMAREAAEKKREIEEYEKALEDRKKQ